MNLHLRPRCPEDYRLFSPFHGHSGGFQLSSGEESQGYRRNPQTLQGTVGINHVQFTVIDDGLRPHYEGRTHSPPVAYRYLLCLK